MKRNALLIGNTGGLSGIAVDIERTRSFLKSLSGGQWRDSEITVLLDPSKVRVDRAIAQMRSERADYSFFLFSGHGYHYGQTRLNLNDHDELPESDLHFIADRQLSIFDCCRVVPPQLRKAEAAMESVTTALDSVDVTRTRYEGRIMQAAHQHAKLYSCSRGESSHDSPEGAFYLSNLLGAASSIGNGARWKTVEDAHSQARVSTVAKAEREGVKQTPCAVLAKLPAEMQLILSIK
ncbi:caspase family protein [Burkholderia gladioli]|uniref:caspase family protein n=1 Tax=Burkholderia gladioli TaxID=28095 RepID=UPI003F78B04B